MDNTRPSITSLQHSPEPIQTLWRWGGTSTFLQNALTFNYYCVKNKQYDHHLNNNHHDNLQTYVPSKKQTVFLTNLLMMLNKTALIKKWQNY